MERRVEKVSLCRVSAGSLYRFADIESEQLKPVIIFEDQPKEWENRDRLFLYDGPSEDGEWGIWSWNASPRKNDPEKDFIVSSFEKGLKAIEIVEVPDTVTMEDLILKLKDGLPLSLSFKNALIYPGNIPLRLQKERKCIFVSDRDFIFEKDKLQIKSGICYLSSVTIATKDVLLFPGKSFFRYLSFAQAFERVLALSPMEVVREKVLSRITWGTLKRTPIKKQDWRSITDFIKGLPAETLIEDIADGCCCSVDEAQRYIDQFLSNAEKYLDYDSLEDQVLLSAIENHNDLRRKCESLAERKWREAHSSAISQANDEITALETRKKEINTELEVLSTRYSEKQEAFSRLEQRIKEEQRTADQVSGYMQEKIQQARKDAAAFITEMAFVSPYGNAVTSPKCCTFVPAEELPEDEIELYEKWTDCIDIIEENLANAGVMSQWCPKLASLLYVTYLHRIPILLAGPNGESIANAFSAALFGKKAPSLDISTECNSSILEQIDQINENVVIIHGAFSGSWSNMLPRIVSRKTYCFVLHPFSEDLLIEPNSLYQYVLPVFTEFLVDAAPDNHFVGGKPLEEHKRYELLPVKKVYRDLLTEMLASPLQVKQLQTIITDFRNVIGREDIDSEATLILFPSLYYSTQASSSMLDKLSESLSLGTDTKQRFNVFMGIEYET